MQAAHNLGPSSVAEACVAGEEMRYKEPLCLERTAGEAAGSEEIEGRRNSPGQAGPPADPGQPEPRRVGVLGARPQLSRAPSCRMRWALASPRAAEMADFTSFIKLTS